MGEVSCFESIELEIKGVCSCGQPPGYVSDSDSGPDSGACRHPVMFILLKSVRKLGSNQAMIIDKHCK